MPARESALDSAIKKHCAALRRAGEPIKHIKIHGSQFIEKGTPDHHITYLGLSIWVEAKKDETEVPSDIQEIRLTEWQTAGAITAVVRSIDEFKAVLAHARSQLPQ